ncbi:hypothetical protein [Actibacterium sp. 188UL27-1]|uniref:hypothetical protein n=1 Tax=Actibacterium sp. 188UL27-1 TaxID=2786961 RepID=UPI001958729E|nr:hypothetical protein [Actibacterium sp. 188UL27-1]MBM7068938.1 hypothetical protein [Actibacterium sp. 188UL27-1]
MRWLIVILLMCGPAAAQDPCPFTEARRLYQQFRPLSHLLIAVNYRKECGQFDDRDVAAIQSLHISLGCPVDSGVGQYFKDRLDAPLTDQNRHPGLGMLRQRSPRDYAQFCRMAQTIPWPQGSAAFLMEQPEIVAPKDLQPFQAFWAHLEAMQNELTRAVTAITP